MIVGCTGHRPNRLGGYSNVAFERLVSIARNYLVEQTPDMVISGMALGWDQAFATAALDLKIPIWAAIPFAGQELVWSTDCRKRYRKLLDACVSQTTTPPMSMSAAFQRRNEFIVDHCDRLCAMWSGDYSGTWNCIKYAEAKNKPIDNLYSEWLASAGKANT